MRVSSGACAGRGGGGGGGRDRDGANRIARDFSKEVATLLFSTLS